MLCDSSSRTKLSPLIHREKSLSRRNSHHGHIVSPGGLISSISTLFHRAALGCNDSRALGLELGALLGCRLGVATVLQSKTDSTGRNDAVQTLVPEPSHTIPLLEDHSQYSHCWKEPPSQRLTTYKYRIITSLIIRTIMAGGDSRQVSESSFLTECMEVTLKHDGLTSYRSALAMGFDGMMSLVSNEISRNELGAFADVCWAFWQRSSDE
jgi:hypothetical protein